MTKSELLLNAWDAAYSKEEWFPPYSDVLNGVSVEQVLWRPVGEHVNTIWETLNHLIFYKERLLRRLSEEETEYPSGVTNDDTFDVASPTQDEWQRAQVRLTSAHLGIRERMSSLTDDQLDERIPQTSIGQWVQNLVLHDAYHIGQIVFIRKLQGSWPSRRSFE